MPGLVITTSDGKTSKFDLESRDRLTVGRAAGNVIVLKDPALSRHHAELARDAFGWMLRDLKSRNGTYLNGERVQTPTALRPGDLIEIGRSKLNFQPGESSRVVLSDTAISLEDTFVMSSGEIVREPQPDAWLEILDQTNRTLAHQPHDAIHAALLGLVCRALRPEHAAIFGWQPGEDPVCEAEWGGRGDATLSVSRKLAEKVIDERVSVLIADAHKDSLASESLRNRGVRSAMATPLCGRDRVSGLIYVETLERRAIFTKKELRLLTVLANAAATQIENARLFEERVRERHLQEQAREAARIQERLLPKTFPEIAGYEFEWHYVACFEVGGDYCDCLALDGERHGIVVADVAGKGLGAAMLMAVTQATLHTYLQTGQDADRLAEHLNRAIFTAAPANRFVTFFFAELDHERHRLRYANAGHQPAPLLVRAAGGIEELGAGSIPLGMLREVNCPVREVALEPGDFLFACSDGVTDTIDPVENLFGEDRLREVLTSLKAAPATEIRRVVEKALVRHSQGAPQPDDLTMAVLRRTP